MKKLFVSISIVAALGVISCQDTNSGTDPAKDSLSVGQDANPRRPDNSVDNPRALTQDNPYTQGAVLIANYDCKTCHAIDEKMIGPSYHMIADRYENSEGMRDEMAHKIIHGGKGRWGDVLMPSHTNLSNDEANQMAGYILSLKTK